MSNQATSYALFLKIWQYAYRSKADNFFFRTLCVFKMPTAVNNLTHNLTFFFGNKVKFWNKIAAVSEVMQNKMFAASWNIKIPKHFAHHFLNGSVIVFIFVSDG